MVNLYDIPLTKIDGTPTTLAEFSGKVLLLVNVASKCGNTPQYTALEALYQRYKDRGFLVLGFPANDFLGQEPGTNQEIMKFCTTEYDVTFPLYSKISVAGDTMHPLYRELTAQQPTAQVADPKYRADLESYGTKYPLPGLLWNFEKFLVDRNGRAVARFSPEMQPEDPRLTSAIEFAL